MDTTTTIRPAAKQHRGDKRRGKEGRGGGEGAAPSDRAEDTERYYSVLCDVCETEMGVQSLEDEVYTFFNVVPSIA